MCITRICHSQGVRNPLKVDYAYFNFATNYVLIFPNVLLVATEIGNDIF